MCLDKQKATAAATVPAYVAPDQEASYSPTAVVKNPGGKKTQSGTSVRSTSAGMGL